MLEIRQAVVDDAADLASVHVASWRWAYAGLLPADALAGLSVDRRTERWRDILADPATSGSTVTLVAVPPPRRGELVRAAGRVVGFCSVGTGRDDVGGPSVGELYALYVHPDVAGTGVGRALHDSGVRRLVDTGFALARLWVLRDNARARRFYERCGWTADGAEKVDTHAEGHRLDEVRYERALDRCPDRAKTGQT